MATGSINISSNISRSEVILQNYPPAPATEFRSKVGNTKVSLFWTDPDYSYTTTDGHTVEWAYTRIVRKTGGYPVNETDGTIVTESSVKNQYKTDPYIDTNLINDTTYYYAAFTCSKEGVFNREVVTTRMTPLNYRVMTVKINLNNSNPATCGSYADDAIGMDSSMTSSDWADFFGYKPCLHKDGKVVGYLNPNNYSEFEDGSTADITSGNSGDVMIEFPRRGIRISKNADKIITISMTDDPNNQDFTYYAHTLVTDSVDYFYLGAYNGYLELKGSDYYLRSISGKRPTPLDNDEPYASYSIEYASNLGPRYGNMGFYQWLYLQVMYLLQYKGNWNSQKIYGGINGDSRNVTGLRNSDGLNVYDKDDFKIFGLECMWGRGSWINKVYVGFREDVSDGSRDLKIQKLPLYKYTDKNNNITYGHQTVEKVCNFPDFPGDFHYYTDCIGSSEAGFIPISRGGSSTTYMCDGTSIYGGQYNVFAGAYNSNDPDLTGLFSLSLGPVYESDRTYARLLYM